MTRLAVIFLIDRRGHVLLQERDSGAPIAPDKWGIVGGHVEEGEEFEPAAYRELEEETGIALAPGDLELWRDEEFRYTTGNGGHYHVYVGAVDLSDDDIVLGEGRQIVFVDPARFDELDMSESCAHFSRALLASEAYARLR